MQEPHKVTYGVTPFPHGEPHPAELPKTEPTPDQTQLDEDTRKAKETALIRSHETAPPVPSAPIEQPEPQPRIQPTPQSQSDTRSTTPPAVVTPSTINRPHGPSSPLSGQKTRNYRQSFATICPYCKNNVQTTPHRVLGYFPYVGTLGLTGVGVICGCCLLPWLDFRLYDIRHTCPFCKNEICRVQPND